MIRIFFYSTLILFMPACSTTPVAKKSNEAGPLPSSFEIDLQKEQVTLPKWVALGSGAYRDNSKNAVFHGVAFAQGGKNFSEKKDLSDDQARDALAKVFNSYLTRLIANLTSASSINPSSQNQMRSAVEEASATILMEAEITDHWENPNSGRVYCLANLNLDRLTGRIDANNSISPDDKSFLRKSIIQSHRNMTHTVSAKPSWNRDGAGYDPVRERFFLY